MNESDNDGRATLDFNTPSELRATGRPPGFDRRHNFQLGFVYALPWQSNGSGYGGIGKALANDWQVNGMFAAFSGNPFTMTASGTLAEHAEQRTQTADSARHVVGNYTITDKHRRGRRVVRHDAFAQPTGVRFGNTGPQPVLRPGGTVARPVGVPLRSRWAGQKRLEARIEAGNIFNIPALRQPADQRDLRHVRADHRHRRRHGADQRGVRRSGRFARASASASETAE